jgi:hypothetical protein
LGQLGTGVYGGLEQLTPFSRVLAEGSEGLCRQALRVAFEGEDFESLWQTVTV